VLATSSEDSRIRGHRRTREPTLPVCALSYYVPRSGGCHIHPEIPQSAEEDPGGASSSQATIVIRKEFDEEAFEKNDPRARRATKEYIESKGYRVIDNPDKYDADLECYKHERLRFYAECEIKKGWKGVGFPFKTVHFGVRKMKYVIIKQETVLFFMWNIALTAGLYVAGIRVIESPTIEVPNKKVARGELFHDVPVAMVTFFKA